MPSTSNKQKAASCGPQNNAKPFNVDYSDMITVLCGPQERPYTVHKGIFTTKSAFFATTCTSGSCREGTERIVKLPEQDPDTFVVYLDWVYFGELNLQRLYQQGVYTGRERSEVYQQQTLRMYFVADHLQDLAMCEALIARLNQNARNGGCGLPSVDLVYQAYENTASGSPLAQAIRVLVIRLCREDEFLANIERVPEALIEDLGSSYFRRALRRYEHSKQAGKYIGGKPAWFVENNCPFWT